MRFQTDWSDTTSFFSDLQKSLNDDGTRRNGRRRKSPVLSLNNELKGL